MATLSKWIPTTNAHHLRRLGKTGEELGELQAVVSRIAIQGIDAIDPASGKTNRQRLIEETADVLAQVECNIRAFDLSRYEIDARCRFKVELMAEWEALSA